MDYLTICSYPYYDAPRNLFYDTSGMTAPDEADDDGTTMAASEAQQTYMNNSKRQRYVVFRSVDVA